MTPFGMPARGCAVSARVDAGDGNDAARLEPPVEVQRGAVVRRLRDVSTQPRTPERAARLEVSVSLSLAPTLPIWGKVNVMIWPA